MLFRKALALAGMLSLLATQPLLAQQSSERSWSLGLALGHGQRDNPLINGETIDLNAVIDFSWYGERWFFDNGDLGFTLKQDARWSFNLLAAVNNERYFYEYLSGDSLGLRSILDNSFSLSGSTGLVEDEITSSSTGLTPDSRPPEFALPDKGLPADPALLNRQTELPSRRFALVSGAEWLYISPWGDLQAQLLSDVSGVHQGQEAYLAWSKPWFSRNGQLTLSIGLEWKSRQLVSYYYGVRPGEAFEGRPAYQAGSATNRFIRLSARRRLSSHWQLVGMVEREYLGGAIRRSPIIDLDQVDTFFAGLYYQF